jgi:hypothetical protein
MSRVTVKVGGAEEFFESGRKIAKIADEGRRVPRRHVVAFDDPADLLRVLTPARMALFRAIKLHPGSITAIAERVRRDRSAVARRGSTRPLRSGPDCAVRTSRARPHERSIGRRRGNPARGYLEIIFADSVWAN